METFGTLCILMHVISLQGFAVVNMQRCIVRRSVTRNEAIAIVAEHRKQAKIQERDADYSYTFTVEPEIL